MSRILLAPLAGVTDWPFRILCFEQGCEAACTEMISAKGFVLNPNQEATMQLLQRHPNEGPLSVQIFGREPEYMAEAAARLSDGKGFVAVDINMGCPVPKVAGAGEGSGLMRTPELASRVMDAVVRASKLPVTVKMRLGWDASSINVLEMARRAEDAGVTSIAVHGRTRAQQYSGLADWDWITRVKETVSIPVIGNGDILSAEEGVRRIRESGVDGVMIARGAMGNPWIFRGIRQLLDGSQETLPDLSERMATIRRHYAMLTEWKGERLAVREMRKHVAWYLHGLHGASRMRLEINTLTDMADIERALNDFEIRCKESEQEAGQTDRNESLC